MGNLTYSLSPFKLSSTEADLSQQQFLEKTKTVLAAYTDRTPVVTKNGLLEGPIFTSCHARQSVPTDGTARQS
jgi:hypothetical protein